MGRYKMTIIFDVHEEVPMKYVVHESPDGEKVALTKEAVMEVEYGSGAARLAAIPVSESLTSRGVQSLL